MLVSIALSLALPYIGLEPNEILTASLESLSVSWFLFFLAILLYTGESLWFLKLYFRFINFGAIFFSSPFQVLSLSLSLSLSFIVSVWFLFELILDYFGSKNLSLYQNTILAMQITDWFYPLHLFDPDWFTLVQFGQFSPICSIWLTSIYIGPLWSIPSNLVHLGLFGPIWSISDQFGPIQCTYLRMGK